nr:uncharacterized protein At5g65660-like [Ipomoea batatas]
MPPIFMESSYYAPPHTVASRPSMGFPLGTALLLILIFSLSGIFSCCYHWDRLRSFRRRSHFSNAADLEASAAGYGPHKPNHFPQKSKENHMQTLPVIMPGDEVPKFLALPCPCQPPRPGKAVVVELYIAFRRPIARNEAVWERKLVRSASVWEKAKRPVLAWSSTRFNAGLNPITNAVSYGASLATTNGVFVEVINGRIQ